jgi:purine-binding chemotaxis protein CheW
MSDNTVNWSAIWDSLESHSDSQLVSIQTRLRQRAQQYAAPSRDSQVPSEDAETVLAFQLGEERYGVDVMLVQAVRPLTKVTRVPGTPAFYKGVVNLRGKIITVLDLRLFFELRVNDDHPPDELVIVKAIGLEMGLVAHHVDGVRSIPRSAIQMPGETRYSIGVTADHLVLLSVGQLFESERLVIGGALGEQAES